MFWLVYELTKCELAKYKPTKCKLNKCELTKCRVSALFSGVIYSLSAYHLAHYMHPTLYNIQWMPLYIICLLCLAKEGSVAWLIISSLMFAVVLYADAYYGYYAMIIFALMAMFKRFNTFKIVLPFVALTTLLSLPFVLWSRCLWGERMTKDMIYYTAHLSDYIYPYGQNAIEYVLYISPVVLLLALFGLRRADKVFVALFFIALVFSFYPPIMPVFRSSARFGFLVMLSASVLAGYGVLQLNRRYSYGEL